MIKSRRVRWARHVACMEEKGRDMNIGILVKMPRGNTTRKPRCRWEDITFILER
jgi:hypothetical protein